MIIQERIQKADGSIRHRSYLKQQKLGKGGFATCYTVERMEDKKLFALKIIQKKVLEKPKAKQKMLSEIKLHQSVRHKSICQLERVFEDEDHVYMLLQLCSNGNMFDLIRRRKKLTIPETQYYLYQLIDGLCHLHNRQIIHRDVKLGNLLINDKMQLKLADFGLATKLEFLGDRKHTVCGTPNYIAPEVILSSMNLGVSGHSYEVDVWSTGVIMYLMLVGKAPFETNRLEKTYQKIAKAQFDIPEGLKDSGARDLLRKMLVVDASKRYTFEEVLNHEFMNPKHGIPKQIPQNSINVAPKFDSKFEKYESSELKRSARDFSINTLRSEVDLSLDEDFEGLPGYQKPKDPTKSSKSKDVKGLLKTVFSSSSLSKSLDKLAHIGRSTTSKVQQIDKVEISQRMNRQKEKESSGSSKQKLSLRDRVLSSVSGSSSNRNLHSNHHMITSSTIMESKKIESSNTNYSYILQFRKQIVFSYVMSSGYIGTYEPTYKLLYNKNQNLYFEAINDQPLKRVSQQDSFSNEALQNRKKFIKPLTQNSLDCQPFISTAHIVYLTKIFEIKAENIILFKLSNNSIHILQYHDNINLLILGEELILLGLENGKEKHKEKYKKDDYINIKNKDVVSLYLKYKKIMLQINSKKN